MEFGLAPKETGITSGILSDIAHELSDLAGWEARLQRVLLMLCEAVYSGTAALAVQMRGWKTFYCPGESHSEALDATLRDHYCVLTQGYPGYSQCLREERGYQPSSILSLPVIGAGRVLGVMHVSSEKENAYSLNDVSVMSIVTSLIGSFLVNVLSLREEKKARRRVERAERAAEQARHESEKQAAELNSVLSSVADAVLLGDAHGDVIFANEAAKRILEIPDGAPYGSWIKDYRRYTLEGEPIPVEESPVFKAVRGETIRSARYKVITPWGKEMVVEASAAPARDSEGNLIGATIAFRDVSERVDYERAREDLLERERRIADTLQRALVPPEAVYEMRCCKITTRYRPALKEAEVGGDFYDVFELHEERIGILIGDVVGKGLPAAVSVAAARYIIRSYAYQYASPGRVLTLANKAITRGQPDPLASILTAFFAIVDEAEGTVSYASGGHEPPMLIHMDGVIEELSPPGQMIGITPEYTYAEEKRTIERGDKLVMFTDGITEARKNGVLLGKESVIQYLERKGRSSTEEIASGLLELALTHARGELQDDAAIVVFEAKEGFGGSRR